MLLGREAGDPREQGALGIAGPVWRGRNAYVYKVEAPWLPGAAALKACRNWTTGKPDATAARRQYVALANVAEKFGANGRYRVPAPYALFEADAAYLAEWIEGRSLTKALASDTGDESSALRLVADAGAWLRHFHAAKHACRGFLDVASQLADLPVGSPNSTQGVRTRHSAPIATLRNLAPEIAHIEVARSWVHGDFKPDNLMVSDDCIYAIDVAASDINIVGFDIAQFLNGLAAVAHDSRTGRLLERLPALEEAFWQGYGQPEPGLRRVVTWLRIVLLMEGDAKAPARARGRALLQWLRGATGCGNTLERLTGQLSVPMVTARRPPGSAS